MLLNLLYSLERSMVTNFKLLLGTRLFGSGVRFGKNILNEDTPWEYAPERLAI